MNEHPLPLKSRSGCRPSSRTKLPARYSAMESARSVYFANAKAAPPLETIRKRAITSLATLPHMGVSAGSDHWGTSHCSMPWCATRQHGVEHRNLILASPALIRFGGIWRFSWRRPRTFAASTTHVSWRRQADEVSNEKLGVHCGPGQADCSHFQPAGDEPDDVTRYQIVTDGRYAAPALGDCFWGGAASSQPAPGAHLSPRCSSRSAPRPRSSGFAPTRGRSSRGAASWTAAISRWRPGLENWTRCGARERAGPHQA